MWRRLIIWLIDLSGLAPKPTQAKPYTHPRYGHFKSLGTILDEVKINWLGHEIGLAPFAPKGVVAEASFDTIDAVIGEQERWESLARSAIMAKYYPLWVSEWRDEEYQPFLEPSTFEDCLRLDGISLGPDDRFDMWFDPGDLFHGHWIEVRCALHEGVREAALAG